MNIPYPSIVIPVSAAITTIFLKYLMKNKFDKSDLFIGPQLMLGAIVTLLFFYENNVSEKINLIEHNTKLNCDSSLNDCNLSMFLINRVNILENSIGKCFECLFWAGVICFFSTILVRMFGIENKRRGQDIVNTRGMVISGISGLGLIIYVTNTLLA